MHKSAKSRQWILGAMGLACAMTWVAALGVASAPAHAAPAATAKAEQWSAGGGTVGVRWNRELAADIGLAIQASNNKLPQLSGYGHELFNLRAGDTLQFDVRNGNLRGFLGGALQSSGGYVLDARSGRIDLTDFRLVPRGNAAILDVVSSDGKAWFFVDRLMYELIQNKSRLAVRTMDLRITPELAARLGHPEVAGWTIADVEFTADVLRAGIDPTLMAVSTKWHGMAVPGVAGATYQADLFMKNFFIQYSRCSGCTGVGGNGNTVFTPSSELINNRNSGSLVPTVAGDPRGTSSALYTADVPWYAKFSGNFPPYNNDQHPYLIWNLYRFNADGSIDQIGRSGVKHAFLTLNTACLDNPGDSHILGRGCSDVYSVSNNDASNALGPRSEIIANTNQWGRCGSIYDTNCDGVGESPSIGLYDHRMVVKESQFSGVAGATYKFESWYLARQDIDIYNSMGTVNATFTRNTTTWSVGNSGYKLGPTIDQWVDPAAPTGTQNSVEVVTPEGRFKVAVKATDLGSGQWRYHYAVMNMDFSRPATSGAEPNLRVLKALGFDNFSVPVGTATITDLAFSDGDVDASNDWPATIRNNRIYWISQARNNALNWGTLFRFSFTANQAPVASAVTLHIAADTSRETVAAVGVLAPQAVVSATNTTPVTKAAGR